MGQLKRSLAAFSKDEPERWQYFPYGAEFTFTHNFFWAIALTLYENLR
ncbi:hypothetical protein QT995_18975 [Microcoleus sp. S36b_A3]